MKKVADLTREEKIDLIRQLQAGTVNVINGNIVELSQVIIIKKGKYTMIDQEFTSDEFDRILELFPKGQGVIILPDNGRDKITEE